MSKAFKDFVKGMGQALDLGATMAPRARYEGQDADAKALSGDWANIGQDIKKAMKKVGKG